LQREGFNQRLVASKQISNGNGDKTTNNRTTEEQNERRATELKNPKKHKHKQ
jgi:hypothetical protein